MRRMIGWMALALAAGAQAQVLEPAPYTGTATGVVFEDSNRNGKRDRGERGLDGVRVSNMREVTVTDRNGRWKLGHTDDTIFYVVKPRGWMTPVDEHNVPRFYYIHKPAGSPALRYKGVAPTGALPASIDFPLHRQKEPDKFTALFFGDPQPRNVKEVDYLMRDIIEPLITPESKKHAFGVALGDIAFDNLETFQPLMKAIGLIGIPWYYVLGNHDINFDAAHDGHSDEHWELTFGPSYYSFQHGPTHFVNLDNVVWTGKENDPEKKGFYRAGLGKTQLEWIRQDLKHVPKNQLIVFLMHIPMTEIADRQELYDMLADRPYTLSVAAHTHMQEHRFITNKDGWRRAEPHHHVINVTACGSWWRGAPNEFGIPHTMMRDGAPHGYSIFTFDGNTYGIQFRAARRPESYQMNIHVPDVVKLAEAATTLFTANVFGGSERSTVEMSFAGGPWQPMVRALEPDPMYARLFERDKDVQRPFYTLPAPANSTHLWRGKLWQPPTPGVYPLYVRTKDMFGQEALSTRLVRVE